MAVLFQCMTKFTTNKKKRERKKKKRYSHWLLQENDILISKFWDGKYHGILLKIQGIQKCFPKWNDSDFFHKPLDRIINVYISFLKK